MRIGIKTKVVLIAGGLFAALFYTQISDWVKDKLR